MLSKAARENSGSARIQGDFYTKLIWVVLIIDDSQIPKTNRYHFGISYPTPTWMARRLILCPCGERVFLESVLRPQARLTLLHELVHPAVDGCGDLASDALHF